MKLVIEANPQAIEEIDPVTGNTILHSAVYKKPLLALLQLKVRDPRRKGNTRVLGK